MTNEALGPLSWTSRQVRNAPLGHQLYRLKIEIPAERSSRHITLQFPGHDLIFVSPKPAASQNEIMGSEVDAKNLRSP